VKTVRAVAELRDELAAVRRAGDTIGLVPTMGALHEGHLSLIRRARAHCDVVVVSLFVNPTQFNESRDLASYPRDEGRDHELASGAGADFLFAPTDDQVYPPGFATSVSVAGVTEVLEGAHRGRGHFDGVTTVVTKLLNMVMPDVAYFGQKDAQQAVVIRRLVRDLDMPVRIEVGPTVREPDGLAMSSRNIHLDDSDRTRAASLHRALEAIREAVDAGEHDASRVRARGLDELSAAGIEPEYLELVSADTLTAVRRVDGDVLALIAAQVGGTRLIDNEIIQPLPTAAPAAAAAGSNENGRR
jgi:pantoate--beta-alanine ligase